MSDSPDQPPATWLLRNLERRLDTLQVENAALAKDLREEIRRTDTLRSDLNNLSERLREERQAAREASQQRDERLAAAEKRLDEDCLTRKDFAPYKNGVVALVTGVGMAMLAGVLKVLGWTK